MRERIVTSVEDRLQIVKRFGLDKTAISRAMNFNSSSMKRREARVYAVNKLGCKVYLKPEHLIS